MYKASVLISPILKYAKMILKIQLVKKSKAIL